LKAVESGESVFFSGPLVFYYSIPRCLALTGESHHCSQWLRNACPSLQDENIHTTQQVGRRLSEQQRRRRRKKKKEREFESSTTYSNT
jgi:hypothetical protein